MNTIPRDMTNMAPDDEPFPAFVPDDAERPDDVPIEEVVVRPQADREPLDLPTLEHEDILVSVQPEASAHESHVVQALVDALKAHVESKRLGRIVGPKQFKLGASGTAGRLPDAAFVSFERWAKDRDVPADETWEVTPDLLIQAVRKDELPEDFTTHLTEYFDAGVRRVWLISPEHGEARDYATAKDVHTLNRGQTLSGGEILPGFEQPLVSLFREGD